VTADVKSKGASSIDGRGRLLATNILWLYGLQGLNYLVPMVMLPYLVRVLGVGQYGLISFAQSIAQYFIIATDYGFNLSAARAITQNREDQIEVARVFWTTLTIKSSLLLIGAIIFGIVIEMSSNLRAHASIYCAVYLAVVGNAIFPIWLFQGLEQMRPISIITGITKVVAAVLILVLVRNRQDTLLATILLSSGFLLAGVVGLTVSLRTHVRQFYIPTVGDIIAALRDGRHVFLTTAAVSLYSNTNTFLVGLIGGTEQAGYFSLADKLIRAVSGLVYPVIQASYPHVIQLILQSKEQATMFLRKILQRGIAFGIVMGLSVLLTARPLAHVVFNQDLPPVIALLRVLSCFPLLCCLNFIFGTLILIPFGFDRIQSRFLISVGIMNVIVGCALIPHFGALGGVMAMCLIEMLQTVGSVLISYRGGVRIFHSIGKLHRFEEQI
jgi:PST family polysaccharide transporter